MGVHQRPRSAAATNRFHGAVHNILAGLALLGLRKRELPRVAHDGLDVLNHELEILCGKLCVRSRRG